MVQIDRNLSQIQNSFVAMKVVSGDEDGSNDVDSGNLTSVYAP